MPKKKTSIAIDTELFQWVQEQIKLKKFASLSHAVEFCLYNIREQESKNKT
jgi:Arc/MetJ-type ribon-helix-helix transcriptional regulator